MKWDLLKLDSVKKSVRKMFWDSKGNVNITKLIGESRRCDHFTNAFGTEVYVETFDCYGEGFTHIPLTLFKGRMKAKRILGENKWTITWVKNQANELEGVEYET